MKIGKHRSGSWIECLKCHCRPFTFFTDSIGHVGVEWGKCLWMSLSQGTIQLAGALATKKFNTRLTSLDEIKCKTLTNHDPLAAIISRRPWRQANDSTRPLWPLWAWKANIWKLSAIKQWKWPKRIVSQQASRCHQSTLKKKKKKKKNIPDADQLKTFRWVDTLQMTAIFPLKKILRHLNSEATRTRKFLFHFEKCASWLCFAARGLSFFLSLLEATRVLLLRFYYGPFDQRRPPDWDVNGQDETDR